MATSGEIAAAAAVLRAGGIVGMPTETVYGLAGDAENPAAVARIFEVKGRPASHPLIVHIGGAEHLAEWVEAVPTVAAVLAERFWPGPLTLVLGRHRRVPRLVTGGLETVAVRVPAHRVALALIAAFDGALAAPSANRFGAISPTTASDVRSSLGDAVPVVLDGGPCDVGVESTIVDLTSRRARILRPGGVTREQLEEVLGYPVTVGSSSSVRVPGQHPSHYAPRARVTLVEAGQLAAAAAHATAQGLQVGILAPPSVAGELADVHAVVNVPASVTDYAHELFGLLRELDQRGCDVILACPPGEAGLGLAIANRLRRAAGPRP